LEHYVTVQSKKKYTVEEQAMGIDKVRTGLRQVLEESDDEEEEEEEEEADTAQQAGQGGVVPGQAAAAQQGMVLQPEHILLLEARGDMNLPRDFPFWARKRPVVTASAPATQAVPLR
jgi:mediator of RNA polymerase II transcription subunit 8